MKEHTAYKTYINNKSGAQYTKQIEHSRNILTLGYALFVMKMEFHSNLCDLDA